MTIGASSPLAPCTVITRTSSRIHLHVALDLGLRRAQPGDEALQRRRLAAFVVEREIEEFIERVVGLVARAGARNFAPALPGAEQPCA